MQELRQGNAKSEQYGRIAATSFEKYHHCPLLSLSFRRSPFSDGSDGHDSTTHFAQRIQKPRCGTEDKYHVGCDAKP